VIHWLLHHLLDLYAWGIPVLGWGFNRKNIRYSRPRGHVYVAPRRVYAHPQRGRRVYHPAPRAVRRAAASRGGVAHGRITYTRNAAGRTAARVDLGQSVGGRPAAVGSRPGYFAAPLASTTAALVQRLAQLGYTRKVVRATLTVLATKGAPDLLGALHNAAVAKDQKSVNKYTSRILGIAHRASQLQNKWGTPAQLAAAASPSGAIPFPAYEQAAKVATNQLSASASYLANKLPKQTAGTYKGDRAMIAAAAKRWHVPGSLLWGVYGTETGFGSNTSTSSAGAQGYMQFEPGTARTYHVNPYNKKSAFYGAAHLLHDLGLAKNPGRALSAYNAGPAGGYQAGYVSQVSKNARSFGKGGKAKVVKRTGPPYRQVRQYYAAKRAAAAAPSVPAPAPSRGSFFSARSSGTARTSSAPSGSPVASQAVSSAAASLAQSLTQQPNVSQALTAPSFAAGNALRFPTGFQEIGQGVAAPVYNPLAGLGLSRRRSLSAYLAGR
jgi:soluble lytic murein transglycosylase-like protein